MRTARAGEWPKGAPDAALLATDPEGILVAVSDGRIVGRAAAAAREDALLLARLEVEEAFRGRGIGRALFDAVAAYGAQRRARAIEALAEGSAPGLALLLRAGLSVRTLALRFAGAPPADGARASSLEPVPAGPALAGWVAALDREARGFARTPEWERAALTGEVLALRRGGRPQAVGALRRAGRTAWIGPVVGASPDAAARLLTDLLLRAGASGAARVACRIPAEAAALLSAARRLGLSAEDARPLLSIRRRGDFRRLSGSPGHLF